MSVPHKSLAAALSAAQGELRNPPKNKTVRAGSRTWDYADLADVIDHSRETLAKHGLAIVQLPSWADGLLSITTTLMHADSDGTISGTLSLQCKGDPQSVGSACTYGRRYALAAIIGVAPDADTDAEDVAPPAPARSQRPPSTIDQIRRALASRAGCTTPEQARCVVRYAAGSGGPTLDDCKASEDAAQVIWEALNSLSRSMPWREFVDAARHAEANNWED